MSVVNLKGRQPQSIKPGKVYCGRPQNMGGWRFPGSKFANPFKVGRDGELDDVLLKYRDYITSTPSLMESLGELRNKVLACWCAPAKCHCDVLLELLNEPVEEDGDTLDDHTKDSEPLAEDEEELEADEVEDEGLEFQIDLDDSEDEEVEFYVGEEKA